MPTTFELLIQATPEYAKGQVKSDLLQKRDEMAKHFAEKYAGQNFFQFTRTLDVDGTPTQVLYDIQPDGQAIKMVDEKGQPVTIGGSKQKIADPVEEIELLTTLLTDSGDKLDGAFSVDPPVAAVKADVPADAIAAEGLVEPVRGG